jgi:threonine dehydratase
LESVGFAWSAKNLRKIKPTSIVTTDTPPIRKRPMMETGIRFQARQRLHDQTWAEMYERLEAYKQKYGVRQMHDKRHASFSNPTNSLLS